MQKKITKERKIYKYLRQNDRVIILDANHVDYNSNNPLQTVWHEFSPEIQALYHTDSIIKYIFKRMFIHL